MPNSKEIIIENSLNDYDVGVAKCTNGIRSAQVDISNPKEPAQIQLDMCLT